MTVDDYQLGLEQAQQKNYAEAIAHFTQALAQNPHLAQTYYQRGLAYYDSGNIHAAVSDYTKALELDDQHVPTYYGRALARVALKNVPGALTDINQAINVKLDYAAAYQLRGILWRKQGDVRQAIADFKTAADLFLTQKKCRAVPVNASINIKQLQPAQPVADSHRSLASARYPHRSRLRHPDFGHCPTRPVPTKP